jgi:hypothetical protein
MPKAAVPTACAALEIELVVGSSELFTPNYENCDYAVRDFSCILSRCDDLRDA